MSYVRKTEDEYEVQGNYGQGFECVTTEELYREAKNRLREYNENEPQYTHKIIKRRVPKTAGI
jgi:hypothetical protein